MRVAIFTETYYPFISGVVTHVQTLREGLIAQGHEVLIVTLDPHSEQHHIKNGVLYCPSIAMKKIYGYGLAIPVNRYRLEFVREFDPDIIHIMTEFSIGLFGLYCAKHLRRPVVYTLHTMYDDYLFYLSHSKNVQKKLIRPSAHWYFRNVARQATEIIGPSPKVAEYLRRCGVDRYINIIPNTADVSSFLAKNVAQADIEAARRKLGIEPGDVSLFFVGRLGGEKSIDVLIDWFCREFGGSKRHHLFIAGDGPEADALREQIARNRAEDQIRLLGKVDHRALPAYFQACDLYATASLSEMNSMSMLEAMASGLYVVQRLDIYNLDQIDRGKNGDVFEDADGFRAVVEGWDRKTPAEKAALREQVSRMTQWYGIPEFTQAVINVYTRAQYKYRTGMPAFAGPDRKVNPYEKKI